MAARARAVVTQNDWRPGIRVTAPTAKAETSVTVVTVSETPACLGKKGGQDLKTTLPNMLYLSAEPISSGTPRSCVPFFFLVGRNY